LNSNELIDTIIDLADEYKATEVKVLQVTGLCSFTDYFILMNGQSTTQIQSLSEALVQRMKKSGRKPQSTEGMQSGEWVLLDFGDVVAHIFTPEKREYYNLEALWQEAPVLFPKADDEETPAAE
jgi:ribosome-associated protein